MTAAGRLGGTRRTECPACGVKRPGTVTDRWVRQDYKTGKKADSIGDFMTDERDEVVEARPDAGAAGPEPEAFDESPQPEPEAADESLEPGAVDESPQPEPEASDESPEPEVSDESPVPEASEDADATDQVAAATASVEVLPRKRRFGFRSRWAPVAAILFGVVVLGVSGISVAAYQYARHYDGKIMPGATIAGVDVGGLTKAEALARVRAAIRPELRRDLEIHWQATRWHATPAELGAKSDARRAVREALYASANASFVDKVRMRLGGDLGFQRDVAIRYPKSGVRGFVQGLASSFDQDAEDAHIDYSNTWVKIVPENVGREVDIDASTTKLLHALRNHVATTTLQVHRTKPDVTADAFDKVLLLHIGDNKLYLYENGKITHTYTVATGQSIYPTPQGLFHIVNKRFMPTWVNPDPNGWGSSMPATIPPGPSNPLGLRAMDWDASGIRFHGVPPSEYSSLGHNASHGCVRMTEEDIIQLYDLVDVGTPIVSIQTGPYS